MIQFYTEILELAQISRGIVIAYTQLYVLLTQIGVKLLFRNNGMMHRITIYYCDM